ncbi:four helix bundle protein [Cerasicoccus fimbriatus]|uniref:four helix bundle protein n=1 Tax=Cerasicoccus fimbriatus TaxID=3014554 RepID=UPI0022B38BBB|nr:four helix bundle protein [Cerasicoccus sp. TK19100]
MATWTTFEEIDAWQKARTLTRNVYTATNQGSAAKDYGLRDQIQRSSVSVMSNIAEGFARGGVKEFLNFLHIARGSLAEVKSQLYVLLDVGHIGQAQFENIYNDASMTEVRINGLIKYLRNTDFRGAKFQTSEPEQPFELYERTNITNLS